jgi:hypothetical protein
MTDGVSVAGISSQILERGFAQYSRPFSRADSTGNALLSDRRVATVLVS